MGTNLRHSKFLIAVLILFLLVGCAWFQGSGTTFTKMTPSQKAAYFMNFYNVQYEDYKFVSSKEGLTEDEKILLRKKKEILVNLYAAISIYDTVVTLGQAPSAPQEGEVLKFINLLFDLGKGGAP